MRTSYGLLLALLSRSHSPADHVLPLCWRAETPHVWERTVLWSVLWAYLLSLFFFFWREVSVHCAIIRTFAACWLDRFQAILWHSASAVELVGKVSLSITFPQCKCAYFLLFSDGGVHAQMWQLFDIVLCYLHWRLFQFCPFWTSCSEKLDLLLSLSWADIKVLLKDEQNTVLAICTYIVAILAQKRWRLNDKSIGICKVCCSAQESYSFLSCIDYGWN